MTSFYSSLLDHIQYTVFVVHTHPYIDERQLSDGRSYAFLFNSIVRTAILLAIILILWQFLCVCEECWKCAKYYNSINIVYNKNRVRKNKLMTLCRLVGHTHVCQLLITKQCILSGRNTVLQFQLKLIMRSIAIIKQNRLLTVFICKS